MLVREAGMALRRKAKEGGGGRTFRQKGSSNFNFFFEDAFQRERERERESHGLTQFMALCVRHVESSSSFDLGIRISPSRVALA